VILAGTPIGDRRTASQALLETLQTAQVVAAEDTRRYHDLLRRLGITSSARVISFFEGNEAHRLPELLEELRAGRDVVVVTDAGMPSVSDPGFRLVRAAIDEGIGVTSVPGPTAVTTALALSGLPTDRFCFEGFLPRKAGERRRALAGLAAEPRTMVVYEAPHRLAALLAEAAAQLGADRPAAVCRELTKTYEEVRRGPLGELAEWAADGVKGEITVVIGGAPARSVGVAEATDMVAELVDGGGADVHRGGQRRHQHRGESSRALRRGPGEAIRGVRGIREFRAIRGRRTCAARRRRGESMRTPEIAAKLAELGLPALPEPLACPIVDSHTHLDTVAEMVGVDPELSLAAAAATGVTRLVEIGCDVAGSRYAEELARTHPQVIAAGRHPSRRRRPAGRALAPGAGRGDRGDRPAGGRRTPCARRRRDRHRPPQHPRGPRLAGPARVLRRPRPDGQAARPHPGHPRPRRP
jgi:16S rRNA (cytidine1402-2'-O)-methyltransferase